MIPQHVGAYTQLVYTKSCIKIKPQFREASSAVTAKKRFMVLAPGSARSRHLAQFYSEPFRRSPATVRDAAEHGRPLRPQLGRSTKSFIWWEMDTVSHSLRRCWNKSSPIFTKSCPKSSHSSFYSVRNRFRNESIPDNLIHNRTCPNVNRWNKK